MSKVTFDYSKACGFVQDHEMQYMSELAEQAKEKLLARTGAGNDFLGWIDLPVDYDKDEFDRIKKAAEKIREDSEVLLVIGIGGSYLGARAAIEFLGHSFANVVSKEVRKSYLKNCWRKNKEKKRLQRGFTQRRTKRKER